MARRPLSVAGGLLLTLEGVEGSGKSTQAHALADRLKGEGYRVVLCREPGGTPLGEALRLLIFDRGLAVDPWAELFLFAASRAQHVDEVIGPALARGQVVICDRFTDSTLAYQGYGRGLDLEMVGIVNHIASRGLRPRLTVLLDLPVEQGLARTSPDATGDRICQEDMAFHRRVRQGYLQLAAQEPQRFLVVDANLPSPEITERVWQRLSPLLT